MALLQASFIQASSHPADTDRLVLEGLLNPPGAPTSGARYGVGSGSTELQVTQTGTPSMAVLVAAGHGWVDGTESGNQGAYHAFNDAAVTLTIAASDPTNPRKDLVVLKVQDAAYSGATNAASLAVVTGTPAASPSEPAVPANAIVLALVDVAAGVTSIINANITDRRRRASGLGGVGVVTSATRPASPYEGQVIYETDTDRLYTWTGAAWKQLGLNFNPPACRVFHSAAQSVASGALAAVAFDSERFDTDTMHDTVTNNGRITFNTAGLYVVSFSGLFAAASDYTAVYGFLRLNGTTYIAQSGPGSHGTANFNAGITVTTPYKFIAGDFVIVEVTQQNGPAAARNLLATGNYSPEFSAVWVGTGA